MRYQLPFINPPLAEEANKIKTLECLRKGSSEHPQLYTLARSATM